MLPHISYIILVTHLNLFSSGLYVNYIYYLCFKCCIFASLLKTYSIAFYCIFGFHLFNNLIFLKRCFLLVILMMMYFQRKNFRKHRKNEYVNKNSSKRRGSCMCIADSLCCIAETSTNL